MYPLTDAVLRLPTPLIVLLLTTAWGAVAFAIHRFVVPRLCGADGARLGKFEAEVTSQIALAFGLLISFNAVWVWERGDRVREAVLDEVAALESVLDEADFGTPMETAQRTELYGRVAAYAAHAVEVEWPELEYSRVGRERPQELIALRRFASGMGSEPILEGVKRAESAREVRVREGQATMPRSRWVIVVALAILTLVSIGALHGEAPRGRALALALVTLAIAFCFAVLFVGGRPFIGDHAIQPDGLRAVLERASRP
ncbi:MAG: hypothetical protein RL136_357 [Planctomycetota bacterium]|jgi:hypothetical protein